MLILEPTTLFYHDLIHTRASTKSSTGLVDNWVVDIQVPIKKEGKSKVSGVVRTGSNRSGTSIPKPSTLASSTTSKHRVPIPLYPFSGRSTGPNRVPDTLSDVEIIDDERDWRTRPYSDEEVGTAVSADSQPIDGIQHVMSSQVPVKLEKEEALGAYRKFTNSTLPAGCEDGNAWRGSFVPTYIHFVATYKDPWVVDDGDAVPAMQLAWDTLFVNRKSGPVIVHSIQVGEAVFAVVSTVLPHLPSHPCLIFYIG
jgi:hypothetical protein